ncbi:MAG: DUF3309 domain-containing protein [Acidithiobacillus ferrivorans]
MAPSFVRRLCQIKRSGKWFSTGNIYSSVRENRFLGVFPAWPHSRGWGYGPSGVIGVVLLIVLILLLLGRI